LSTQAEQITCGVLDIKMIVRVITVLTLDVKLEKQNKQCAYNVTFRRIHKITVAIEKSKYYIPLCVCARARASALACARLALLIQHKNVCSVFLSVDFLAAYFSTLSHKRKKKIWKKVIEHKICFDFLYNIYLKRFSL
jgi:hypothetical protein